MLYLCVLLIPIQVQGAESGGGALLIPVQEQGAESGGGGENPGGVLKPKCQVAESQVCCNLCHNT